MFVSQITTVNDFIYKYMYKNTPTQTQNQQNIWVPIKCETKRNEINENETKSTKTKRNQWNENEIKTKPTEAKRNQRNQNEIENGRKNNRGLKEIKPIFTITMLDHFPRMSVCLSSGEDRICHHWTRILCIYSAGVCPFDLVVSFKFGNHKSNVKSVERRGIKKKKTEVQS